MTDSLIFHGSRYSEASLMDSRKTSNDTLNSFRQQRLKYSKHPIISRLNMNSLKNKLTSFKELILSETDVTLSSESKRDKIFPNAQFQAEGYKLKTEGLLCKDRNKFGGEIILQTVRNDRNKFGVGLSYLEKKIFPEI